MNMDGRNTVLVRTTSRTMTATQPKIGSPDDKQTKPLTRTMNAKHAIEAINSLNSLEQAAKALFAEMQDAEHSLGDSQSHLTIIAKHLEAFAREQNGEPSMLQFAKLFEVYGLPKNEGELRRIYAAGFHSGYHVNKEQNRELLKDKERVDLLETMNGSIHLCHMSGANIKDIFMTGKDLIIGATIREALDKAALAKRDV